MFLHIPYSFRAGNYISFAPWPTCPHIGTQYSLFLPLCLHARCSLRHTRFPTLHNPYPGIPRSTINTVGCSLLPADQSRLLVPCSSPGTNMFHLLTHYSASDIPGTISIPYMELTPCSLRTWHNRMYSSSHLSSILTSRLRHSFLLNRHLLLYFPLFRSLLLIVYPYSTFQTNSSFHTTYSL